MPKVRALCSAGVTQPRRSYDPVRLPSWPLPSATLRPLLSPMTGLPPITRTTFPTCRAHYPGGSSGCRVSIASPLMQPSPNGRRVGIRISTFEACSGFAHVTARRIAQPPKATFVARLRPGQSPGRAARQLPELSTIIRVEPSSTDDSHLRGALPIAVMNPIMLADAPIGVRIPSELPTFPVQLRIAGVVEGPSQTRTRRQCSHGPPM
jgi:hypothetical protein